jgi:hypothetical protein
MSTEQQARALMMRHHHIIKNRQQSMLSRAAVEVGMSPEASEYWNHIQGQPHPSFRNSYDRTSVGMS